MVTNPRFTTLPITKPTMAARMFLAMGFMVISVPLTAWLHSSKTTLQLQLRAFPPVVEDHDFAARATSSVTPVTLTADDG
jgi:hypothetical protein